MLLLRHAQGAPPAMIFIAPANHTMPFASFDNGEISAGLVKDISEVLARRMGYAARFRTVPGKRVGLALSHGEADGVCFVRPGWIDADFNWTRPAIPGAVVIVANAEAPVIKYLGTLSKERIGTYWATSIPAWRSCSATRWSATTPLRMVYTYVKYKASCAFSVTSPVRFAEVERVLAGLVEDGTMEAILARYR